ncbi:hypothetical protein PAPYR_2359 [Paratrimastix pyriformis]|uniref:Uncharacterized protein n=1 Tax=Paratrimastix pyriformis TaxID=342808 RepID=A0ABQ8UX11_9EUKA|nr:hypothetical protein PAPYR_2359 [Paratrimastix pyriformis]
MTGRRNRFTLGGSRRNTDWPSRVAEYACKMHKKPQIYIYPIHKECLEQWIRSRPHVDFQDSLRCDICHQQFRVLWGLPRWRDCSCLKCQDCCADYVDCFCYIFPMAFVCAMMGFVLLPAVWASWDGGNKKESLTYFVSFLFVTGLSATATLLKSIECVRAVYRRWKRRNITLQIPDDALTPLLATLASPPATPPSPISLLRSPLLGTPHSGESAHHGSM